MNSFIMAIISCKFSFIGMQVISLTHRALKTCPPEGTEHTDFRKRALLHFTLTLSCGRVSRLYERE